ncbi:DUF3892 domain-containing protein [Rhodopirellula baltica]
MRWANTLGAKGQTMDKWADYCITAVRYDRAETRITHVETHYFDGESLVSREVLDVTMVIRLIKRGISFITVTTEGLNQIPKKGQPVQLYDHTFIRSVGNRFSEDNLEELPRF